MRALITGGGKRLGRALAMTLAHQGYDIAIHYGSSAQAAQDTADEIRAIGCQVAVLQADLLVEDEVTTLVSRAATALGGPVDVLINNASIFEPDSLFDADRRSWDRHMGSNLRAPLILTQAFALQKIATGLVVNMVDQRVRKLTPQFMTYTLAKSALWTLTQTAAQALGPQGIRVNAIAPGPTLQGSRQSPEDFLAQQQATLLGTGGSLSDITQTLCYLLGAKTITGQMLCVDGGQHLGWETPDVLGPE